MEYGQTSRVTTQIRALMERISELGSKPNIDVGNVLAIVDHIHREFPESDDVFVTAAEKLLTQIANDGRVSDGERHLLSNFANMYENPISDSPVTEVSGKAFVLTGDFAADGGKATVSDMVKAAGGVVKGGVSKKVSYVVAGSLGSDAWAFGNFGQKVKKALDLKLTGKADIRIVSEKALMCYLESKSPEAMGALREKASRFERQWKSAKVVSNGFAGLTEGQQKVLDLVKSGRNVYLTGLGGTGKSYVLDKIIDWAQDCGKNVVVCAPTGIAALNVGGCTIHRALGIRPSKTLQIKPHIWLPADSPLVECDLMIVDEISMCRMDLFDYLSEALRKAGVERERSGRDVCQLVVVGDFCQLPPVLIKEERPILEKKYGYDVRNAYPFMGIQWEAWAFQKVELTEAIRQRDADFVAALNACRVGDTKGLRWIEEHSAKARPDKAIVLCGTNEEAAKENRRCLEGLPGESLAYIGRVNGEVEDGDLPTARTLHLKRGARVMALVNDSEKTYMNGSLGNVVGYCEDGVLVRFDSGYEARILAHEWNITKPALVNGKTKMETVGTFTQIPLKLAYAMTIHKAQGQTFQAASIYPRCWDPGQLYTALSRLTSIEGLHLAHACSDKFLIASDDVIDFIEGRSIKRLPLKVDAGSNDNDEIEVADERDPEEPKTHAAPKRDTSPHVWTPEEETFILDHPHLTARELAARFGVTRKSIERKRAKLRRVMQE